MRLGIEPTKFNLHQPERIVVNKCYVLHAEEQDEWTGAYYTQMYVGENSMPLLEHNDRPSFSYKNAFVRMGGWSQPIVRSKLLNCT